MLGKFTFNVKRIEEQNVIYFRSPLVMGPKYRYGAASV